MITPLLYISFHQDLSNIYVYSLNGEKYHSSKLLNKKSLPENLEFDKLRDFRLGPDGNLYVINAHHRQNQILRFNGQPNHKRKSDFMDVFASAETNSELLHPFQMAFNTDGNLLVSCQNSNAIVGIYGPEAPLELRGKPMPNGFAYQDNPNFPDIPKEGVFIPSACMSRTHKIGLKKVRGITFASNGNLLVADEKYNSVAEYDGKTGEFLKNLIDRENCEELQEPVHLLVHKNMLYVGNKNKKGNNVLCLDLTAENPAVNVFINDPSIQAASGMCFYQKGGETKFLLADRLGQKVVQYNIEEGVATRDKVLLDNLGDNPEFLRIFSFEDIS